MAATSKKKKPAPRAKAKASAKSKSKSSAKSKKPAAKKVSAVPKGYGPVLPYLVCRGAAQALDFYKEAFGAKEKTRMTGPDGTVMHAEFTISNCVIMLGEENLHMGQNSPESLGGSSAGIMLYVSDVDKVYVRAVAAGAKADAPPMDMFWGDRYGRLTDPFGHKWSVATHTKDMTPKQMQKATDAFMAEQMAASAPKP